MNTEKIIYSFAKRFGESLNYSEEQTAVLAYGLFGLIQTIFSIAIIIILGYILGIMPESLIISFSIAILRKFSGGAHATSAERCLILGTLFSLIGSLLGHLATVFITPSILYRLGCLLFIWGLCIVYKYAPIASPNKPITNIFKIQKLKQRSVLVVSIYFAIVIILFFISNIKQSPSLLIYGTCLTLGMSWQVFTITKLGHKVALFLDNVLIYISHIIIKENKL